MTEDEYEDWFEDSGMFPDQEDKELTYEDILIVLDNGDKVWH